MGDAGHAGALPKRLQEALEKVARALGDDLDGGAVGQVAGVAAEGVGLAAADVVGEAVAEVAVADAPDGAVDLRRQPLEGQGRQRGPRQAGCAAGRRRLRRGHQRTDHLLDERVGYVVAQDGVANAVEQDPALAAGRDLFIASHSCKHAARVQGLLLGDGEGQTEAL